MTDEADRRKGMSDAFLRAIRAIFGSGKIDPMPGSVTVTINELHPGDKAMQAEIVKWIVGSLGRW